MRADSDMSEMKEAKATSTSAERLAELAATGDSWIRLAVANNPNTNIDTLESLAREWPDDPGLHQVLKRNPNLSAEFAERLSRLEDQDDVSLPSTTPLNIHQTENLYSARSITNISDLKSALVECEFDGEEAVLIIEERVSRSEDLVERIQWRQEVLYCADDPDIWPTTVGEGCHVEFLEQMWLILDEVKDLPDDRDAVHGVLMRLLSDPDSLNAPVALTAIVATKPIQGEDVNALLFAVAHHFSPCEKHSESSLLSLADQEMLDMALHHWKADPHAVLGWEAVYRSAPLLAIACLNSNAAETAIREVAAVLRKSDRHEVTFFDGDDRNTSYAFFWECINAYLAQPEFRYPPSVTITKVFTSNSRSKSRINPTSFTRGTSSDSVWREALYEARKNQALIPVSWWGQGFFMNGFDFIPDTGLFQLEVLADEFLKTWEKLGLDNQWDPFGDGSSTAARTSATLASIAELPDELLTRFAVLPFPKTLDIIRHHPNASAETKALAALSRP